jgi:molybdopterin-binding protein
MITADSARALGLEVGSKAIASVKSTDVVVENG